MQLPKGTSTFSTRYLIKGFTSFHCSFSSKFVVYLFLTRIVFCILLTNKKFAIKLKYFVQKLALINVQF